MLDARLKSRLKSGALGFGGAPLGNLFHEVAEDDAIALVRHAHAAGVRYFDTAPHYGNGLSETRIGAALRGIAARRVPALDEGRKDAWCRTAPRRASRTATSTCCRTAQRWDYSHKGTLRSIEDSLQRLGVSRLDIVFIHDIDRDTHGAACAQCLREVTGRERFPR